jgi:hypothetical protein
MSETYLPSQFAKWKRSLIGGFLSALIAEVVVGTLFAMSQGYIASNLLIYLISVGFATPMIAVLGVSFESIALAMIIIFIFWFLAGALIGRFTKTNLSAIVYWFLLYILCVVMGMSLSLFSA